MNPTQLTFSLKSPKRSPEDLVVIITSVYKLRHSNRYGFFVLLFEVTQNDYFFGEF